MITSFLRWEAGVLGKWGATQGGRRAVDSSLHGWGTGSLLLSRPTDHRCPHAGEEEGEPGKEDNGVPRGLPCCHPSSQNSPYSGLLVHSSCSWLFVCSCMHSCIHPFILAGHLLHAWDQAIGQYAEVSKSDSSPASVPMEDEGEGVYRPTMKPTWFTCSKGNGHRAKTEE